MRRSLVVIAAVVAAAGCSSGASTRSTAGNESTSTPAPVTTRPRAPATTTTAPTTDATNPLTGAGPGVDVYAHTRVGMLSPKVRGFPERVYVPNSLSNTVDVIDPATLQIIDHYSVGALPQHIVPAYDLETLYVNNNRGNSLTPIDPRTGKPAAPIAVDDPYNLYFTPDGTKAVVMEERNSRITFRDPHSWQALQSVPIAHRGVNHADFTPNGRIMIASCEFSGWLVRLDLSTMTVTGELDVGGAPIDVRSSPDGSVMYVANQQRNGVSVVDPVAMKEIQFIPTGVGAHGLYPTRDGKHLLVTNRNQGTISVIDFASRRVVATWHIGGSPDMGGISADGKRFWVTSRYTGEVLVVDTTTGSLVARIRVGSGPHGLAIFPQPGRYSLGHTGNFR